MHMLGAVVAIRPWFERHKMSLRKLKEEFRQTEDDPTVKGRLRQLRQTRMRKRMMAAVPKASVNHQSDAFRRRPGIRARHECVGLRRQGVDLIARKILDVALSWARRGRCEARREAPCFRRSPGAPHFNRPAPWGR